MFNRRKVLQTLMQNGGVYADVYTEEKVYTHIQMESGSIERLERAEDRGNGIRLITPWKTYYASTNLFDDAHLTDMAQQLAKLSKEGSYTGDLHGSSVTASYPFSIKMNPDEVEVSRKIALVSSLEQKARKMDPRIVQVRIVYRDTLQKTEIGNSDGQTVRDERTQVTLNVYLVGQENGEMQTSYEAVGGFSGFEFFSEQVVEELAVRGVKRLSGLFSAREAPMGMKTVVLASEAGGTMIHEAIGHGLEADLALEGLSCYKGMLGEKIASDLICVADDATLAHRRGTYAFDDEGVPGEKTILVQNGVLQNYLFDRFYALKHGKNSTGNGRRESFRYKPIPRMSNTMILPGKDDPAAILASVDDGVLVMKMGGGQVDTVKGDFVFEISEGYLIEKGTIGPMIKNATMMGNGLKVLQQIDMVGNDLGFGIGTCGKDGQGVPIADAQPTLRMHEIIVGGKGQ